MLAAYCDGSLLRHSAHQIRGRLTPMLTVAQMLKRPNGLDAETLAWAGQSLEKKILELSELAETLQNPAKQQGGESGQNPEPLNLNKLVGQAVAALPDLPGIKPPAIDCPGQEYWVTGRQAHLYHPLVRCLLDAAGRPGGMTLKIRDEAGQALIGIGNTMPSQPAEAPQPRPPGMGLKLAKILIEQEGGEMDLRDADADAPFPSSEIVIRLPLSAPPAL